MRIASDAVLQLFDLPVQGAQVALHGIDALRHVEQALVRDDPLDARDARVEIPQFDLHGVFLSGSQRAAGERRRHRNAQPS